MGFLSRTDPAVPDFELWPWKIYGKIFSDTF